MTAFAHDWCHFSIHWPCANMVAHSATSFVPRDYSSEPVYSLSFHSSHGKQLDIQLCKVVISTTFTGSTLRCSHCNMLRLQLLIMSNNLESMIFNWDCTRYWPEGRGSPNRAIATTGSIKSHRPMVPYLNSADLTRIQLPLQTSLWSLASCTSSRSAKQHWSQMGSSQKWHIYHLWRYIARRFSIPALTIQHLLNLRWMKILCIKIEVIHLVSWVLMLQDHFSAGHTTINWLIIARNDAGTALYLHPGLC